jgi:trehalose/maltose hydrolase-like predicted phosphorylase
LIRTTVNPARSSARTSRLAWIAAELLQHDSVSLVEYQRRFDMSSYTFRYELRMVREADRTFRFYFYLLGSMVIFQWITGRP